MGGKAIRIATWNIASNKNLDALVARIAALDVDICAMQEVSVDPATDLPALLQSGNGKAAGYTWHFAPALVPEQRGGGRQEFYGLGVLSRIPLRRTAPFQLGPISTGAAVPAEAEPRILQIIMPELPQPMLIANTHLAPTEDWSPSAIRRAQAQKIADALEPSAATGLVVLCGDFNAGPTSDDLAALREALPYVHCSTVSTYIPEPERPPIDFFFTSAPVDVEIAVRSANGLSDHDIVMATFAGDIG